jgi:2-polyprenyl-3-methyl-5-hydroxy-6-metoxy-1,4-benzoquinol methylase
MAYREQSENCASATENMMKISQGMTEQGIIVGNTYDKYQARNFVTRRIMHGFELALSDLIERADPQSIHEVGCGEGYWVLRWAEQGMTVTGSDFSAKVIELARANALFRHVPAQLFKMRSIYDLNPAQDVAELVVCCEVLEHLERPQEALRVLQSIAGRHLIVSVPREPLWSMMNMMRGKYLSMAGNTPGHIQRWSQRRFIELVADYFDIVEVRAPVPWTMLLCRPHARSCG